MPEIIVKFKSEREAVLEYKLVLNANPQEVNQNIIQMALMLKKQQPTANADEVEIIVIFNEEELQKALDESTKLVRINCVKAGMEGNMKAAIILLAENKTPEKAAEILNIKPSTVYTYISRAKDEVRKLHPKCNVNSPFNLIAFLNTEWSLFFLYFFLTS